MPRSLPVVRFLDGLIEFGWLFLIVAVPTFFNVNDERTFEPDKIVVMRNTVLIMVLLLLIKGLYLAPLALRRWSERHASAGARGEEERVQQGRTRLVAWAGRWPVIATMVVFMVVYLLATVHSIIPWMSFWGSYDRMEGLYTYLNYAALLVLVATHLRTRAQVERLVTAVIVASIPASTYSWVQHFNLDPLIWGTGSQTAGRTPSTLGNPIFLAAFVLMTTPFTLHRIIQRVRDLLVDGVRWTSGAGIPRLIGILGYALALILQTMAVVFSASRGPGLGFLAALFIFGLSLAIKARARRLLRATVALAVLVLLVLGATNTVLRPQTMPTSGFSRFLYIVPSESGSSEVRALLWRTSLKLAAAHPILGCGPEVLLFCWYPDYPPELMNIESPDAAPDRSHDEEIDVLLMSGVLGELAYLAMLAASLTTMFLIVRRSKDYWATTFSAALMATYIGHIVEGTTGIAFSATLLMFWIVAGCAAALRAGPVDGVAGAFSAPSQEGAATLPALETPTAPSRVPARRTRDTGRSTSRRAMEGRGGREVRAPGYVLGTAVRGLTGAQQALFGLVVLAVVAIAVGFAALFVDNVNQILADVEYRQGQNYEQTALQFTSATVAAQAAQGGTTASQALNEYQQGLNYFQIAISHYGNALQMQPSQDTYYLFLGKSYLEYADALNRDPQHVATRAEISVEIQRALTVFQRAERNNPLDPDHPRNIAKLYNYWGLQAFGLPANIHLLALGDASFAKASSLAPHNPLIMDEWAILDIELGTYDTAHAHQWYADARAHLERAKHLQPTNGVYYRDLASVYEQYGLWAQQANQPATARQYYLKAAQDFEKAVGWIPGYTQPSNSQAIYPRLATLYATKINDVCQAGQFALYTLNAIKQNQLSAQDSTGAVVQVMQQEVSKAQARSSCHLKQP